MGRWRNHHPRWVADLLQSVRTRWWVAGGWALELFAARPLREHSDIEIGCFRSDVPDVLAVLSDWDVQIARNKMLSPFETAALKDPTVHGLWCRRTGSELWDFEILIEERLGAEWVYRRDHRIRRPLLELSLCGDGIPYLRPDVQLLYKSQNTRPKDDEDFAALLPLLGPDQQTWLMDAIRLTAPECRWPS
jgi:hypothetical protein